uniref:hypothetical protein n=1 Tax=Lactococcus garvieae TaxID=1363 RepID=UPI001E5BB45A|nr:hypothetical protein [Lactococcus garvieae]
MKSVELEKRLSKGAFCLSSLKNILIERNIYNPDRPFPKPRTLQENTSEAFALLDTTWEEFIKAKQVEYASRTNKKLEQYENELREQYYFFIPRNSLYILTIKAITNKHSNILLKIYCS